MTTRTWVGGDNHASNPNDWSPSGLPQPGDSLVMNTGTMTLSGQTLAGDTLTIGGNGTVDINTIHATTLKLATAEPAAHINIHAALHSTLTLTVNFGSYSYLNVSGGKLAFIGTSGFGAFSTVLKDDITGTGTLDLSGGNASGENMEINGSVASGLTFNIYSLGIGDAGLQIDHPSKFHAAINMVQSGWVAFEGIHATRGELFNGILEMFDGKKLVDAVRLTNAGGVAPQLQQNSQGVMFSTGLGDYDQPGGIGTAIPLTVHV
nr:hypothetical protein [uncultured Rhodopila sp.]